MANILDYVEWRGDLSFSKSPVNEVDIVVLSQIVMLDLNKCVPKSKSITLSECVENYFKRTPKDKHLGFIIPADIAKLFEAIGKTERYSSLLLSHYVEDIDVQTETQFSALTIDAPAIKTKFVLYSGTDDTIVGWKENFNLIYKTPTRAQIESVKYLNKVANGYEGKIIVLGHSKGGHLAMYASAECKDSINKHVKHVYNLDGPGFPENEAYEKHFKNINKRILTLLPQSSVIGRLFEHGEAFKIVHSDNIGLFQHDCFSWQVRGTNLIEQKEFKEDSLCVDTGIKNILNSMDEEEREKFVEGLFGLLSSAGYKTLTDLAANSKAVIKEYFKTSAEIRKVLNRTAVKLLSDKYLRKCIFETTKALSKTTLVSDAKAAKGAETYSVAMKDNKKLKKGKTKNS